MSLVVVDAGGANLGSVCYALQRLGVEARVSADPVEIRAAPRLVLPGVGAAGPAMARLHSLGLVEVLRAFDRPLLGICLGMQLLFEASEEGDTACLGRLPGRVSALRPAPGLRVPHMGWNRLRRLRDSVLLAGIGEGEWAYFVHGYAAPIGPDCVAACDHGGPFAAVVERGPVMGAQFHPERSAAAGRRLLANFLELGA
ncbi:imidazole glycerol phosphate synthase subunit HisH [Arenimonas fontis]|uniref:Imidazole glycerol phosphate synthase subunit HisH n=1 Tax=Arenimonas fontis TaxID=2608255 RepID=A0A5B2Z6X0_9GAMM|nr:imidazole glycerol phosphate synthase subunit HisH [Arenimonas fontis]KAA2284518.1 imidazole glycerol phosphate synthase subunit HisH [Arenimonas fontis]